jgi:alkylation response protein AidB-like acyl-CoA dehydrogenase
MVMDVDTLHRTTSAGFVRASYRVTGAQRSYVAAMPVVQAGDVLAAVHAILPFVRENAERSDGERAVPAGVVERIAAANVFRLFQPKRYGGLESDLEPFFNAVAAIGGACASTGWVTGVLGTHQWVLAQFPEQAQDDVWGADPDALSTGSATPGNAVATPAAGGFRITGTWRFCSGSKHAGWHFGNAAIAGSENGVQKRALVLLPASDVTFADNWNVNGLRGTASCDGTANGAFVPAHRMLYIDELLAGATPGQRINAAPLYRLPNASVVALGIAAPPIGAVAAALASFIAYATTKESGGGIYGEPRKMRDSAVLQARMAGAGARLDAARALVLSDLAEVQAGTRAGTLSVDTRVRVRRDLAYAVHGCVEIMDAIYESAGTEFMFTPNPLERAWRDVNAAAKHVGLSWDNLGTAAGRHLFGLEPRAQY